MTETLGAIIDLQLPPKTATDWTTDSSVSDNTIPLCSFALMKCTGCHKLLQTIAMLETRIFALEKTMNSPNVSCR